MGRLGCCGFDAKVIFLSGVDTSSSRSNVLML